MNIKSKILFTSIFSGIILMISGCSELNRLLHPPQAQKKPVEQASTLPPMPTICAGVTTTQAMDWLKQDTCNASGFPDCKWGTYWEVQHRYDTPLYKQAQQYCSQGNDFVEVGSNCQHFYTAAINDDTAMQAKRMEAMSQQN